MNPTEKYTDALLDAKFDTVQDEMRGLRDLPLGMGRLEGRMERVQRDVDSCHQRLRELRDDFEAFQADQATRARWIVTSIIAAAGVLVATLGVLASAGAFQ